MPLNASTQASLAGLERSRPVLVTGATGYVAGQLIRRLLEEGLTVHAAVRDPGNSERLAALMALGERLPGELRVFASDLLKPGSYAQAMAGCAVVFHTASPFVVSVLDPERDLVRPAVDGTRNVLEEANRQASVERVVLTSSCAAIYSDNADAQDTPRGCFDESVWNTTASLEHQAYSHSKTLAEQAAWQIAEQQSRWRLVVINPSLVLGPAISDDTRGESFSLMTQLCDGTLRIGAPDYGMGVVDVRDVAEAHLAAGFLPTANGRHLVAGHSSSFIALGRTLRRHAGSQYSIPTRQLPKWLVWLAGPLANKAVTRKVVARNVGHPFVFDNTRSREQLGLIYRPLEATLHDMLDQLEASGRLS
ncbi:NAD-dependent epimerase/dehydratase family protein [Cobetia sp. 1AS1]|uniref:NAD-dependent epimerase/dehydratase family protein n=1 Tax=Cobetia sp. 1AS1 TaxID=3040016 RepID=UPI002449B3A8|nr:NAD-dependent epimerase/dehydratase family protein [Cobetia sp. 1AS1]MDH2293711.1 NAD-dependent epimerase/dehydratase family protein [Cobetia sp. 1AS1]